MKHSKFLAQWWYAKLNHYNVTTLDPDSRISRVSTIYDRYLLLIYVMTFVIFFSVTICHFINRL